MKLNATPAAAMTSAGRTRSRYESPLSTVAKRRCATTSSTSPMQRHPLGSEPGERPRQDEDADSEPRHGCREHGETGEARAVLEHLLQQQCDEHETGDASGTAQQIHRDATAHASVAKHAGGQDRVGRSPLDEARTRPRTPTARTAAPTTSTETSPRWGAESTPKTTATAAPVRRVAPRGVERALRPSPSSGAAASTRHADDCGDRTGHEKNALPARRPR